MGDTKGGPFDISAELAAADARWHRSTRMVGPTPTLSGLGSTAGHHRADRATCGSSTSASICRRRSCAVRVAVRVCAKACETGTGQEQPSMPIATDGGCTRASRQICAQLYRIATDSSSRPRYAKHRLFVWIEFGNVARHHLYRFRPRRRLLLRRPALAHPRGVGAGAWARMARANDPRYNNTTCFETFPFPWPPGQEPADDPRVAGHRAGRARAGAVARRVAQPARRVRRRV